MKLSPEQTYALVVGIEDYPHLPSDWHLHGPALDAVRFVKWLRDCGVPAGNIRLCLSPDIGTLTADLDKEVKVSGATRQEILSVLDDHVAGWKGELLFVYWGGHGSIDSLDPSEPRRLYFADASVHSPVSLSLPSLIAMLQRERKGRIPRQALFIDACALFQARAGFKTDVAPSEPAVGLKQDATVQQFQLFASRRGEAAINLDAERTGAFSKALREALRRSHEPSDGPHDWPPNLVDIAKTVQAAFDDLIASGKGMQRPIFRGQDWDGSSLIWSNRAFAGRQDALIRLRLAIERLGLSTGMLLSLLRASFPESPKLADILTLDEVFDFLAGRSPTRAKDWPPEAEFCERIRRHCVANAMPDTSELTDCLDKCATVRARTDLGLALDNEDEAAMRYLVIELTPDPASGAPRVEQAWLYRHGQRSHYRCWTPHELSTEPSEAARVRRVVRDAAGQGVRNVTIELITPKRHLGHSPDMWMLGEDPFLEPLNDAYPVVVRWRERLAEPTGVREGRWLAAAQRILDALTTRGLSRVERLPAAVSDPCALWRRMEEGSTGELLAAGDLPVSFAPQHPLICALYGGAPAACWWTRAPADDDKAVAVLETMLKGQRLEQLAVTLFKGRRSADVDQSEVCRNTILFWDHLDRNPYAVPLASSQ